MKAMIPRQWRRTVSALVLVLAASAIAFAAHLYERRQGGAETAEKTRTRLADFSGEDVREIEFRYAKLPPVRIVHENGTWVVRTEGKPVTFADPRKVSDLLDGITGTRLLREIKIEPGAESELALAEPEDAGKGRRPGFEMLVYGKNGRKLLDAMLGDAHFRPAEQISERYSVQSPDGRYVRIREPDGTRGYYLISRLFETCFPYSGHWIEQLRAVSFDIPERILFQETDENGKEQIRWSVRRKTAGNAYYLEAPKGMTLKPQRLDAMIKLLAGPFTRDIAPVKADFKPDSRFVLALRNGFVYTLEMQNSDAEMERYGRLSIRYEPENLPAGSGEADPALQTRHENLRKQYELEKEHFEGKLYVLQPNVIKILRAIPGS